MQKYKIGFLVGRFQPFHKGHLHLIKKSFQYVKTMIIGVGSVGRVDKDNFLTFQQRKEMLETVIKKEGWSDKITKIVPLKDFYDNELWLKHCLEVAGKIDVVIGNNEWTNGIFERAGYPILRLGFYRRYLYEGVKIRELIRGDPPSSRSNRDFSEAKWEDRVPKYLISNFQFPISKQISNFKQQISKYTHLVYAGTFDRLHVGHKKLLSMAFELGEKVAIGITSEKLHKTKPLADLILTYEVRRRVVEQYLRERNWLKRAKFFRIDDIYGPSTSLRQAQGKTPRIKPLVKTPPFDSILVTELTRANAEKINKRRIKKGLPALEIIVAPLVRGDDGEVVTSERIRMGEIDREGHNFQIPNPNYQKNPKSQLPKKILTLPKYLRQELRKPIGRVFGGSVDQLSATARKIVQSINRLDFKPTMVITVGDIVTMAMFKVGFDPDVKIIDLRSRRKEIELIDSATQFLSHEKKLSEKIAFASSKYFKESISKNFNSPSYTTNIAGTINLKAALVIKSAIINFNVTGKKRLIIIRGEEDLLVLPAVLLAPLQTVVLYGQMDLGVVMVEVTEEKKEIVKKILKKFK